MSRLNRNVISSRVAILGYTGAGKSSVLLRYLRNTFMATIPSTTGIDFQFSTKKIQGKTVKLQLWDTSGQQKFESTCTIQIKPAKVAILVFDITSEKSLQKMITWWLPFVQQKMKQDAFFIIYGNKQDMLNEDPEKEQKIAMIENKLKELKAQYPQRIKRTFIGSCKDQDNTSINQMMDYIFQTCYQEYERNRNSVQSQYQELVQRNSVVLQDHPQNNLQADQNKKNVQRSRWNCW